MHKWMKSLLLLGMVYFLTACQNVKDEYQDFLEDKVSQLESKQDQQAEPLEEVVDLRFVPSSEEFQMALENAGTYQMERSIYKLDEIIPFHWKGLEVKVEEFYVLPSLKTSSKTEALAVIKLNLHNSGSETITISHTDIQMSALNTGELAYISKDSYPAESGNLYDILQLNNDTIHADETLEAYAVFPLEEEILEHGREEGFLMLTFPNIIVGEEVNDLLDEFSQPAFTLYVPLSNRMKKNIIANNQWIHDRLSTEFWGIKEGLNQKIRPLQETEGKVSVSLDRLEISSFEPFSAYEDNFANFTYGQVIVTVEYSVMNGTNEELYPVAVEADLVINGDRITDDYLLINEYNTEKVMPSEKKTFVRAFALDKKYYQQNWQNEPLVLYLSLEGEEAALTDAYEEINEIISSDYYNFVFEIKPELLYYVDEEMTVIPATEYLQSAENE